jgi:hypothetical protein
MRSLDPELQIDSPAGRTDPGQRRDPGDPRGDKDVSPVSSDATGVRQRDAWGREDATRPRRRYITY